MDRLGLLIVGFAAAMVTLVILVAMVSNSGWIDNYPVTPSIALSQPTVENDRTAIIGVDQISRLDVRYSDSRILLTMPDSTTITWSLGSSTWTGNETSYQNASLGCTITFRAYGSQGNPQSFSSKDQITIECVPSLLSGHWMVTLVYLPTGNFMGMTEFDVSVI